MTPTLLYRIAAVLLVLFAVGHTIGFLTFRPPSPQAVAVRESMDTPFTVGKSTFSYGGFYVGFGLNISIIMLFEAYLAWFLGTLARVAPTSIGALGWVFVALPLSGLVFSLIYFGTPPAVFSALLTICLAWAAWLVPRTNSQTALR